MLVSAAAIYGVGSSSAFDYAELKVEGNKLTDATTIESTLVAARGQNLFELSTAPLVAALEAIPTVRHAHIEVRLPATLGVTVEERQPVLIWQVGDRRLLAAGDGSLFEPVGDATPADVAALPVVDDRRSVSAGLVIGARLDSVDLDAATRLASLRPVDLGSAATGLAISITDENGFVVSATPKAWSAIFGFYTPSLRTTELIPGQVRLLRSLLDGREAAVDRVILASATDGTYTSRATPASSAKPSRAP